MSVHIGLSAWGGGVRWKMLCERPFFSELEIAFIKALNARSWPPEASSAAFRVQIRDWSQLCSLMRVRAPNQGSLHPCTPPAPDMVGAARHLSVRGPDAAHDKA